ncbi:peptide chain release factor N(5)-glutamine methyltransferase [Tropicimonas sp. S265A]|uniref:peptide chain release factor N(5)-glutamine methyltransferase n=1 Tax=Tropicimonas sp. S265A TaxID=3415134 RepID=UPI003C7A4612
MKSVLEAATAAQALSLALSHGRGQLGTDDPIREAKLLLALAAGVSVDRLPHLPADVFTDDLMSRYQEFLERRAKGEPISHIRGTRAFWTHDFLVSSDVLDPRPETETLVEAALEEPFERVLDLGTGSGCILLTLLAERPAASGVGVDISEAALSVAVRNRAALGLEARAELRVSDWFASVEGVFNLIVANPPYVDAAVYAHLSREVRLFEPKVALTPGPVGTAPYRIIARDAARVLTQGGRLLVEIGYDQAPEVVAIFSAAGFSNICVRQDLGGKDRVVDARKRA